MGVRRLERSARRALDRLNEQVGTAGLLAAAAVPGLAAVVDQHAAAVRDILTVGVESGAAVAGVVLLAGYAQGVQDHLRERGEPLHVPKDLTDWLNARLVQRPPGRGVRTGQEPPPGPTRSPAPRTSCRRWPERPAERLKARRDAWTRLNRSAVGYRANRAQNGHGGRCHEGTDRRF